MQTIQLQIKDSYFEKFLNLLHTLPEDEVKIIDKKFSMSDEFFVNSIESVQKRVYEAEERIKNGNYITEDAYKEKMDEFFKTEFDLQR